MGNDGPPPRRLRAALCAAAALLALAALAAACLALRPLERRLVDSDQVAAGTGQAALLGPGATVGQTFVARHAGLAGVELWVDPAGAPPLSITLHLRAEPAAGSDLATATAEIPAGSAPGFFRFDFPARADSLGRYYYAWVEAQAPGASLPLAEGAAYLDGAAYRDGEPLDAQAAFRLVYAVGPLLRDLAQAVPRALGLLGALLLVLVLPGWALLALLGPERRLSWAERLGLSAGIGLALLPLLLLWTDVAGLRLGAGYAWIPAGAAIAVAAWRARRWRPGRLRPAVRQWVRSQDAWPDVTLAVLLALLVTTRLLVVRTLEAPLYGDGYQHTLITQLLVDHGGLFDSWEPYTAIDRFTYHFGFHTTAAALHWLTGLPVAQAVLWTGQMLNVLAVLSLYPLAVRVGHSRWAGVACVLVAGLLSPMPSEYLNWGRYTQLAGQVVLPAAAWLTWEMCETSSRRGRSVALAAVAAGGLALTHYRVLAFYAAFVVAMLPLCLRRSTWRGALARVALAAVGAALLFLPWLVHTFQGSAISVLGHQLTTLPSEVSASTRQNNTVRNLARYLAPGWWATLPLALAWAVLRRRRGPLLVLLWTALLVLAANPAWLGLPGTGAISNFAIVIAAYIPAGLLAGFLATELAALLPGKSLVPLGLAVVILLAGLWGSTQRLRDADLRASAYVTRPDVRAAAWIRENTGAEAKFLVNSSPAYGGLTVVGTDGGWWLPLLAGRQVTVPPLNYANELGRNSALRQQLELPARLEEERGAEDPGVLAALREAGVTHVYVGQRQGQVNDTTSVTLDPGGLARSGLVQPIYHEDRVWIFRLAPAGGD